MSGVIEGASVLGLVLVAHWAAGTLACLMAAHLLGAPMPPWWVCLGLGLGATVLWLVLGNAAQLLARELSR